MLSKTAILPLSIPAITAAGMFLLFGNASSQSVSIPSTAAMGQALSANVTGSYTAPPANFPSVYVTDAALTGNGDMAIILGGASSALKFYVGKADFFGVLHGQIQPVGSLILSAPSLSGSSYSLNENVGPATITGAFINGSYGLSMSSWVANTENTAVIQLTNTGSQPLTLSSKLTEGFEGTTGNPATYGGTNNSTWLFVSPDTVNIELGNELYNVLGSSPFTGSIADFKLFTNALSGTTLASIDASNAPMPFLQWQATNNGTATLVGSGVSINASDAHGGSVVQTGGNGELLVGDLPFPEHQFTISTWVNVTASGENSCIVAAQIPYTDTYGSTFPYPYVRGLSLNLVNGALSATLNESGYLNTNSTYQTFFPDSVNRYTTTAASAIPVSTWVEAAVTYDGNVMTLYTNGVQVGTPVTFPTGTNGMYGYNKMAVHIGDTNLPHNGCAPVGTLMQTVVGATTTTNSQGTLSFTIPAGGQASIVLAAVTDLNNTNYFAAAQQQSEQATANSLAALWQGHQSFWSNFWSQSFIQIPDQKIQNEWYASLYLLACSSGTNTPPPGLWGNFITTTDPGWEGDYTLDYNSESPFYTALANNHMELAANYEQPLIDQISRGEGTAQYIFGYTNSIQFYTHLIPGPGWDDDPGTFWGMKSDAAFAAVDTEMHWKYTLDTNFAAKVYPYLKGVVNFWDNYLVYTTTNGYAGYIDYNDSADENSGPDTYPATTTAFLQLLYPTVLQMSEALNVDAASRAQWSNIISNLYPLSIVPASSIGSIDSLGAPYNSSGVNVIRDTLSGTAFPIPEVTSYQSQQLSGSSAGMNSCQAIFPGWLIGLESPAAILQAATNTIWIAAEWFDNNDCSTFYPGAACCGFDPNLILTNMDELITDYSYHNFMYNIPGGGMENVSIAGATLPAMFLQSYQTNIHVFPDWPTNQSAAFGNLNACGGFLVSSAITLGAPNYIQIQSTAGQMLNLVNPWTNSTVQCVSSINGTTNLSGSILNYQTQIGEVLILTSTSVPNLSSPTNVTASTNSGSVVLNWNPVSGAAGYNVARSTSSNGLFVNLGTVTSGTDYTDSSVGYNTPYCYEITAIDPGYQSPNPTILTVTSGAKPPIVNNSFELQDIGEGNYLVGDPTDWSSSLLSGAVDAVISPGPSGTAEPWPTIPVPGLNGTNFCQIFATAAGGGGLVYQDTGMKYQAGTTYILTAAFGLQNSQTFDSGSSFGFYNSSLTSVSSQTISTNQLSVGTFTNASLTYTATGNEGGNGDIIIGFYAPAAASGSTYFDFDNASIVVSDTAPPTITTQPLSQTTSAGSTVSFSVVASGAAPLSYQWYLNTNTPIAAATNAALTLTNVQSSGTYDVVMSNPYGSITSSIATLTAASGAVTLIDAQFGTSAAQSGAAVLGSSGDIWNAITATTTNLVSSSGSTLGGVGLSLSCQGIFTDTAGSAMDAATTALMEEYAYSEKVKKVSNPVSISLTGLSQYEGDTFTLVVYAAGDTSGQGARLSLTGASGGNAASTLSTTAASRQISLGNGVAYQTFTGTLTNGTLGITASILSGGTYAIVNGLQLQLVPQTPTITAQPISESTNAGSSVAFSVVAGTAASYQWYFDTNTPVSGATNATLSLTNVQSSGTYDVVVSNPYGSITSSIAKLTVLPNPPASFAANPGVNAVTLTYGAVANAKFYVIYRSKVNGGSYTKIATTAATKYTDRNVIVGTTYYYVVIACDGTNLSSYSSQASATAQR